MPARIDRLKANRLDVTLTRANPPGYREPPDLWFVGIAGEGVHRPRFLLHAPWPRATALRKARRLRDDLARIEGWEDHLIRKYAAR